MVVVGSVKRYVIPYRGFVHAGTRWGCQRCVFLSQYERVVPGYGVSMGTAEQVVVIGGGLGGLAVAIQLASQGQSVTLLEARE